MASQSLVLFGLLALATVAYGQIYFPIQTLTGCTCGVTSGPGACATGVCYAAITEVVTNCVQGTRGKEVQTVTNTFTNVCYSGSTQPPVVSAFADTCLNLGGINDIFTSPIACACPSGGCGDPVITGYDGRAFDFKGEADKYFNLISETNHVVNAKFVDAELKSDAGNFMGEIGFKYKNATVKAAINREGIMTVEINGEEQPFAQSTKDLGDGMLVEIEPHFPQLGHIVVITTPLMIFRIEAIKPFEDATTGFNRGYLNVLSILREQPQGLHGILGQTAYNTDYYPLTDMQFHGEGQEMDYTVSSLFAHDFKFNTFTFTGLTQAADASRRLLVVPDLVEKRVVVDSEKALMAGHNAVAQRFL